MVGKWNKEFYKKYNNTNLDKLFNKYNMNRFWKQYLPKELINKIISDIEKNDLINFFNFEKLYCGNNILKGVFFNDIKDLFFLYDPNIVINGIYIDKEAWYIFFVLNNKWKYYKINYEKFDFNITKNEFTNKLFRENKIALDLIRNFSNYIKNNNKKILLSPTNYDFKIISNIFLQYLELNFDTNKNETMNYNTIFLSNILSINLNKEIEDKINTLLSWDSNIFNFKDKLIKFIKYLASNNKKPKINYAIKNNEIDFIFETDKFAYGVKFLNFRNNNNIYIEENNKNKEILNIISQEVYFPFENKLLENYILNFNSVFNFLNQIKTYKRFVKANLQNKQLPIKFITLIDDEIFKLKPESIEKIKNIIASYNIKNPEINNDEFHFISEL